MNLRIDIISFNTKNKLKTLIDSNLEGYEIKSRTLRYLFQAFIKWQWTDNLRIVFLSFIIN